jgi:hypothetical protein
MVPSPSFGAIQNNLGLVIVNESQGLLSRQTVKKNYSPRITGIHTDKTEAEENRKALSMKFALIRGRGFARGMAH